MRSMSIGTPAESPSKRTSAWDLNVGKVGNDSRAGFTLIEALVSLALVLAFASALGPLMYQSQRILVQGDGQVKAELLLRTLLETGFNRASPDLGQHNGETAGLRWRIDVDSLVPDGSTDDSLPPPKKGEPSWGLFRITAHVFWGDSQTVTAQTLQLGQLN
jgi:prepilin-type N-terminal cleavage/methylation domain-containing protein